MRRGEVWLINLDPTLGAEIKKTRPAAIVSDDAIGILPLKVIVPLTEWKDRYSVAPWLVRVEPDAENGLEKSSAADAFQVAFRGARKVRSTTWKVVGGCPGPDHACADSGTVHPLVMPDGSPLLCSTGAHHTRSGRHNG